MSAESSPVDQRRTKGKESRELILQSAISCVAATGLSHTTLDRIAAHAGVSRGLVVFHFKSKNRLLKEVLDYLGTRYGEGWDLAQNTSGPSTMGRLFQLLDYDVRFASENPVYVSAWHAFWGEAKGNSLYRELSVPRDDRYEADIRELLATLIEEGNHDPNELSSIDTGLTAILFGLWLRSHLHPRPDDYVNGMTAVRLFLNRMFPNHPLPPIVTASSI